MMFNVKYLEELFINLSAFFVYKVIYKFFFLKRVFKAGKLLKMQNFSEILITSMYINYKREGCCNNQLTPLHESRGRHKREGKLPSNWLIQHI